MRATLLPNIYLTSMGYARKKSLGIYCVKRVQHATLDFMHCNFRRIYQTLRVTPAMQARLADHVWELKERVALLD
jgi:hypothetical protein